MNMFNISIVVKIHTDSHKDTWTIYQKKEKTQHTTQIYLIILFFWYYYMYEINIAKSAFVEVFCYNYKRMFMFTQTVDIEMLQSITKAFIQSSTTCKSMIR